MHTNYVKNVGKSNHAFVFQGFKTKVINLAEIWEVDSSVFCFTINFNI